MPWTKIQWALYLASKGLRVFPLRPNTKKPEFDEWPELASTDPSIISAWWAPYTDGTPCEDNLAVCTTDMVVIDIDVKKGGRGFESYELLGNFFDTFVVQTPSGGKHCYFAYHDSKNKNSLFNGIDVKSHRGYVVGPGSTVDGVPYSIVNDMPLAWLPVELEQYMKAPSERADRIFAPGAELDDPDNIALAVEWLKTAPLSVEGQAGNTNAYKVAAKLVRNFALSDYTALEVLQLHWNDRCLPPWSDEELYTIVRNAMNYGESEIGCDTPKVMFAGVNPLPEAPVQPNSAEAVVSSVLKRQGVYRKMKDQQLRPWVAKGLLQRKTLTLLSAPGGTGKSLFTVNLALHAAFTPVWGAFEFSKTPCTVLLYSKEDDVDEVSYRVGAACLHNGFNEDSIDEHVKIVTRAHADLVLATCVGGHLAVNMEDVSALKQMISEWGVDLAILDPVISMHRLNESDPGHMDFFAGILTDIATETNCALIVVSHTVKNINKDNVGESSTNRGSSALVYASRRTFILSEPMPEDMIANGMDPSPEECRKYLRVHDAKQNFSEGTKTTWYFKQSVMLPCGESAPVCSPVEVKEEIANRKMRLAHIISSAIQSTGQGSMPMPLVVDRLKSCDDIFAKMTSHAARAYLDRTFSKGVDINGLTVIRTHVGKAVHMALEGCAPPPE